MSIRDIRMTQTAGHRTVAVEWLEGEPAPTMTFSVLPITTWPEVDIKLTTRVDRRTVKVEWLVEAAEPGLSYTEA